MDSGLAIFLLVMAAVIGLIWVAWRHRRGALARGIGSAGAAYNDHYGQGRPPQVPLPPERKLP
jgi:hypothetical protein